MKPLLCVVCLFSTLLVCCNEIPVVPIPASSTDVLLQETKRVTPVMRSSMEGVYSVSEGNDVFGDQVALKWSYVTSASPYLDTTFTLSVFSGREACYFALQGGTLDSVFLFSGYWRKTTNTETGIAKFTILSSQGGHLLFQPNPVVQKGSITFTGEFGSGDGLPNMKVTFKYERPLYKDKDPRQFEVIAHRGGGRTSDMLPVSENTVDMILFTPRLGSTALEIDVRLTKDNKLILYHDGELNSRLTQPTGLVGTVEEYTYAQLRHTCD